MGTSTMNKKELIGEEYRKQYLEHYILESYKDIVKESKFNLNFFYYSYIAFIINGIQNETISFREIMKLKTQYSYKFTIHQSLMINYFFDLASQQFELEAQRINTVNSEKLIDIILFDESIQDCSKQLVFLLNLKYDILQTISRDYINLQELERQLALLVEKREILLNELIRLQNIHSLSTDLISLCEGFEECLTIDLVFTKMKSITSHKFGVKNYLKNYSDETAAVYISLLQDIGKIIKVSKNFKDVVPLVDTNQEAIGKNIRFIQPNEISQIHDAILLQSIQKKKINQNIKNFQISIGKDRNGWAVAYNLKVQMFMIGNSELGSCGLLKQISDDNMYVMTNTADNFRIIIQDEKFYKLLFKKQFSQQNTKKIQLGCIIPMLRTLKEKGVQGCQYETILFQPESIQEATKEFNLTDQKCFIELLKKNLFFIRFSFYQTDNELIQITQLQINSVRYLIDLNSKKEALRNFKIQLLQFLDINSIKSNFNEIMNSLNGMIESTDNKQYYENINDSDDTICIDNLEFIQQSKNLESYQLQDTSQQNSKILVEDKIVKKSIDSLGQIQEETEQNSIVSPELNKKKESAKFGKLFQNFKAKDNKKLSQTDNTKNITSINTVSLQQLQNQVINTQQGLSPISFGALTTQRQLNTINQLSSHLGSDNQIQQQLFSSESHHTQNILSSDSLYLSPRSTNRKLLQAPETNRSSQLKLDQAHIPIIEKAFEDDLIPKQLSTRKRESTQSTNYLDIKQLSSRNKNFSVKKNQQMKEATNNFQNDNKENNTPLRTNFNQMIAKNQDDNRDEGSVKSSRSQRSQSKIQILSTIRRKDGSKGLKIINLLGIFSICIICCLNIVSFQQQLEYEYLQKINFEQINWTFSMKRFISIFFGNASLIKSLQSGHYLIPDQKALKRIGQLVYGANQYMYEGFKNYTQMLVQGNTEDIYVFHEVNEYNTHMALPNILNFTKMTNYTSKLTYKLIFFQNFGYYIANLLDPKMYNEIAGGINYLEIHASLDEIYENNQQYQLDKIDNIKQFILGQLIMISVVSGFFSLLSIPIYIFNMKKKEDILKLFATIPSDKIIQMMMAVSKHLDRFELMETAKQRARNNTQHPSQNQLKNTQNLQNSQFFGDKQEQFFISSNQIILKKPIDNMKKKNISSTNNINKFNSKLILGIIICLGFTLFYPITNYIFSQQRIETYQMNIYFLNSFDYLIDNLTSLFCIKYTHSLFTLFYKGKYPDIGLYLNTFNNYRQQTQSILDKVVDNFAKYEKYHGYLENQYDRFMIPIIKGDICKTLNDTDPIHYREVAYTYEDCISCLDGIFQKGLLVLVKKAMQMMDQYYEISAANNFTIFKSQFIKNQMQISINAEYEFFVYQMYLSKIVHYYQQDTYVEYYDYNQSLQISIISIQVVLLILVALFGWRKFYNGLSHNYFVAKQHLDIIDINILVENPYVLSYFKKNS